MWERPSPRSAATVMCGIGMMFFAQFGKFQEAGVAIPLTLFLVLCATLSFSPALLRLAGRWAFWPQQLQFTDGCRPIRRRNPGETTLGRRHGEALGLDWPRAASSRWQGLADHGGRHGALRSSRPVFCTTM